MKFDGTVFPNGLDIRKDATLGYHITARTSIPAGATIIKESPWASGLGLATIGITCRRCLSQLSPKALADPCRCTRCGCTLYCCESHATADSAEHTASGECLLLQSAAARSELGEFMREACLAARIAWKRAVEPPLLSNWESLLAINQAACGQREAALIRAAATRLVAAHAAATLLATEEGRQPLSQWQAEEALCCVVTNGLEVIHTEDEMGFGRSSRGVPAALFKLVSRINHSCRPTAYYFVESGTCQVVVRTLVALQPGQQVTIAYVDCLEPGSARREALQQRFCFECTCERCSESGTGADAFLHAISPSEDAGCGRVLELEAALESLIATGVSLFIDQGDAGGCRKSLGGSLSRLLAAGVHPLHYHCLEAYCLLTSACRAAACTGSDADGAACAAAYALSSALAADHLVRAGETGVIAAAGRQWLWAARLLCDCAAGLLQTESAEGGGPRIREALEHISTAAGPAQMPRLAPEAAAAEDNLLSLAACPPCSRSSTAMEQPVVWAPAIGACLMPCSEAPSVLRAAWAALMAEAAAGVKSHTSEEGKVLLQLASSVGLTGPADFCAVAGPGIGSYQCECLATVVHTSCAAAGLAAGAEKRLAALAFAAVHAMAHAARLLHLVHGQTHPLCEATMFAPFFSHLQAPLASAIVAAANGTVDHGLS